MNNTEFVSALNEYSFSGENDKILKILMRYLILANIKHI